MYVCGLPMAIKAEKSIWLKFPGNLPIIAADDCMRFDNDCVNSFFYV